MLFEDIPPADGGNGHENLQAPAPLAHDATSPAAGHQLRIATSREESAVVPSVGPRGRQSPPADGRPVSGEAGLHHLSNEEKLSIATNALTEKSKRGQTFRKSVLYELNNQRSKKTEVESRANFDSLCHIFNAFLSGCGRESSDVSNTKMLMILSQTFYMVGQVGDNGIDAKECNKDRQSRIYVKNNICHHSIWSDEDFWDQALYQCVSESLSKSGVLLNYVNSSMEDGNKFRRDDTKEVKWHDLSPSEYAGAASQVHSVVFAQLGTLSRECVLQHPRPLLRFHSNFTSLYLRLHRLHVGIGMWNYSSVQLCPKALC